MTDALTPLTTFDDLRRAAIGYAQDASGEIWTDYNVHDPGVTLLEQTCFALSQLAYQTDLPIRDLLTTPQGHFLFNDIGMPHPGEVLRTAPVTCDDLEAFLSTCDDIEGVALSHCPTPGHYDIVVFGGEAKPEVLENRIRTAFDSVRPLGTLLDRVVVAERVDVVLKGKVEISSTVNPDTIAAEIYFAVRSILTGQTDAVETAKGATRADVYDAPELMFDLPRKPAVRDLSLENHLSLIRKLPGVREIESLSLERRYDPKGPKPRGPLHLRSVLPKFPEQVKLELTVNGAPMTIDPARLREDFIRIDAERMGQSQHHIAAPDWNVLQPGRRRRFDLGHVDALLPMIYQAAGHRPEVDETPLLAQYRAIINGVLQSMAGALRDLPTTFQSDLPPDRTDPALYRAGLGLLDYFLALQGHEMPATRHTGLHSYHGAAARHRFEIDWRAQMLSLLPDLHATRGTAPGPHGPGGFLTSLALLCDLDPAMEAPGTSTLRDYSLRLVPDAPLEDPPKTLAALSPEIADLLDLLPVEDPDADPYPPDDFARTAPFLKDGMLCPAHFHRLADPDTIRVRPGDATFDVIADLGESAGPRVLDTLSDRKAAYHAAARIRATWRMLHRRCETVHLVEAKPRALGPPTVFNPVLLIPGWTYRCSQPGFRTYVEAQVARLAPAHMHFDVVWLARPPMPEQPA